MMRSTFLSTLVRLAPPALAALWAVVAAAPLHAQGDDGQLEAAVRELAGDIKTYLTNDAKEDRVALGSFNAPPIFAASGGKAIREALSKELEGAGIEVSRRSRLECKGEFLFDPDDKVLVIKCDLVEQRSRSRIKSYDKQVFDIEDIASLVGASGALSVADSQQRTEDLVKAIEEPTISISTTTSAAAALPGGGAALPGGAAPGGVAIRNTRIAATPSSPYGIEICMRGPDGEFVPVEAENDEGLAFVDLPRDAVYAIRVFNNSPQRAAVTITIDALNVFHFSDIPAYRQLGKLIVPPKPEGSLVKGWHRDNAFSYEFIVGDYAEAEAVKARGGDPTIVQSDDEVGVITVSFAVAVGAGEELPPDEKIRTRHLGTVKGPDIEMRYREEPVRIGNVREVISVRYSRPLPVGG